MLVTKVEKVRSDKNIPLYDIQNVEPYNNFLIKGKTGYIVSHNCGAMDEVSFGTGTNKKLQKKKMLDVYYAVKMRMKSRFLNYKGKMPTVLLMISSKNDDMDFLEVYIRKVKDESNVYLVDSPLWDVKPKSIYSGKKFKVAIGNKYLESEVVENEDEIEDLLKQGYEILEVPIEHKSDFMDDTERALRDIAGISTTGSMKFLSAKRYKAAVGKRKNPFTRDILKIGLDDDLSIKSFFNSDMITESVYSKPVFIHIDTSLNGDKTGITAIGVKGAGRTRTRKDEDDSAELFYRHLFSVAIQAPSDSEISLEKTRQFIYYLKALGWNIKAITTDGFQSADTQQTLKTKGFDAKVVSLDRNNDGYNALRAAVYEKRISLIDIPLLEKEATELEKDGIKGKIDHPIDGSKDIADSLAGALLTASRYKSEYMFNHGEDIEMAVDLLDKPLDPRVQAIKDLEGSLRGSEDEIEENIQRIFKEAEQMEDLTDKSAEDIKDKYKDVDEALKESEPLITTSKPKKKLEDFEDTYTPSSLDDDMLIF